MVLTSKRLILYFNPRSHERSDCYSNISLTFSSYFNPRSHERSDAHSQRVSVTRSKFQSTLPREERRTDKGPWLCVTEFQSTLPREERLITRLHTAQDAYFNPRSHERSDAHQLFAKYLFDISIHAPTRGATIASITS